MVKSDTSKTILLLLFILMFFNTNAQNTWVVSNDPGFGTADFDTIQNAVDAASSGDKIYVHGSSIDYLGFTIDKKLHMIGSGFWKVANAIIVENTSPTTVDGYIYLDPGSDSSIVEGFRMIACEINADNIIFRYNHTCCNTGGLNSNGGVAFKFMPVNPMIYGNVINNSVHGPASGGMIFNNILIRGWSGTGGLWALSTNNINCLVQNNAISSLISIVTDVTFRNNIAEHTNFAIYNSIAQNNIFVDDDVMVDGVPTDSLGNGNIDSVDINTVWNLSDPSPDGKYQLIGNSMTNPAFGAGVDGEDCGPFGGVTPYRLSGIVKIPLISQMLIPLAGDTTNMLKVTIKAKSN